MADGNQTLYDLLNLRANASQAEIEEACFHYGEKFRPDKNPGDAGAARMFAVFEDAFATLGSPSKRAEYDRSIGVIARPAADLPAPQTRNWKLISMVACFAVLAVIFATGLLTYASMKFEKSTPIVSKVAPGVPSSDRETVGAANKPAPITYGQDSAVSSSDPDSCFLRGKSVAAVYLANISQAAEIGLMASRVMDEACTRLPGSSCVAQCELGFRSVARSALR